jgi:glycosyltransferase involved in cell wall biosynthesis
MINKIKVIFVINTITHYQLQFFNFLKKYLSIKILFQSKSHKNYNFSYKKNDPIYFLEKYKNKKKFIKNLINNFKPNFLILGGYKLEYNSFIIKCLEDLKKTKYFFWLEKQNENNKIKLKIVHFLTKNILFKANGILSIGEQARRFYRKYNKNILNLPYSIQVNKLNKRNYFNNNKINFLFVGQLIKRKGVDIILNVINDFNYEIQNKAIFTFIGNGTLSKKIKTLAKIKKNIKYYSFQDINTLNKFYLNNDVLLFPSRFDGWGVVPMEAMSNAMLVIAGNNCGVNELLKKNKGNFIINNSKDLSKAMIECIDNKDRVKKFGAVNRSLILNSIYNVKNSSKLFKNYINKYDIRN